MTPTTQEREEEYAKRIIAFRKLVMKNKGWTEEQAADYVNHFVRGNEAFVLQSMKFICDMIVRAGYTFEHKFEIMNLLLNLTSEITKIVHQEIGADDKEIVKFIKRNIKNPPIT